MFDFLRAVSDIYWFRETNTPLPHNLIKMSAAIQHFLLVFDHAKDELIAAQEFGRDVERATEAYSEMEKAYANNNAIDIVLVGSDSLETVKITHANYFAGRARRLMHNALHLDQMPA
ncbi:hypothetical protein GCM10022249_02320 [Enteractinococcus coprophilus]